MSFFGSIGKFFKRAVKSVTKIARKATTVVATGGLSLVSKSVRKAVDPFSKQLFPSSLGAVAKIGLGVATRNPSFLLPSSTTRSNPAMAFNLGGFLGNVGGILGSSGNSQLATLGNIASLGSAFVPQRTTAVATAARAPISRAAAPVRILAGSARGLTQEIFTAGNKVLSRLGIPFSASPSGFTQALKRTLASIASLARRTPGGTMVSLLVGLGMTAGEAYLLTSWQAQRRRHRRMNPANSRALRRAARRIRSFHKLCQHTDLLKTRSHRFKKAC